MGLQFQYLSRIRESQIAQIFADDDSDGAMTTMQIIFSLSLGSTQSRSSGRRLVYIVDVVFVDFDFDVKNDQRSSARRPTERK
jgi:hypothetical protein